MRGARLQPSAPQSAKTRPDTIPVQRAPIPGRTGALGGSRRPPKGPRRPRIVGLARAARIRSEELLRATPIAPKSWWAAGFSGAAPASAIRRPPPLEPPHLRAALASRKKPTTSRTTRPAIETSGLARSVQVRPERLLRTASLVPKNRVTGSSGPVPPAAIRKPPPLVPNLVPRRGDLPKDTTAPPITRSATGARRSEWQPAGLFEPGPLRIPARPALGPPRPDSALSRRTRPCPEASSLRRERRNPKVPPIRLREGRPRRFCEPWLSLRIFK